MKWKLKWSFRLLYTKCKRIHLCILFLYYAGKLFHRVILMSGSALAPWAVVSDPARATLQVASTLNCTEEQLQAQIQQKNSGGGRKRGRNAIGPDPSLLGCLRSVPLYQLMRAARIWTPKLEQDSISQPIKYIWGPSLDGVVVHSFKRRMRDYLDRMARWVKSCFKHIFQVSRKCIWKIDMSLLKQPRYKD